jgi:hypothetical protein
MGPLAGLTGAWFYPNPPSLGWCCIDPAGPDEPTAAISISEVLGPMGFCQSPGGISSSFATAGNISLERLTK